MRATAAPRRPAALTVLALVALIAVLVLGSHPASGVEGPGSDGTSTTTTPTTAPSTTSTTQRPRRTTTTTTVAPTTTTTVAPSTTTTTMREGDRCSRRRRRCEPPTTTTTTTAPRPQPTVVQRPGRATPTTSAPTTTGTHRATSTTLAPSSTTTLAIPPLPATIGHGDDERAPHTALAAASVEEQGKGGGSRTLTTVAWIVAVCLGIGVFGFVLRLDKRLTRR